MFEVVTASGSVECRGAVEPSAGLDLVSHRPVNAAVANVMAPAVRKALLRPVSKEAPPDCRVRTTAPSAATPSTAPICRVVLLMPEKVLGYWLVTRG
ncbi:hypothetical protein [Streptomyces sp. DT171]|uniref:hypothetical protein n=1 Tax=Streptomyces sp. DT171 TaxID=3416524 RepID=UPI003CEF5522